MIGAVEAYIKTIVGLLVMTAFTQIIVPDGGFKKYVSFVMGLLVAAAVISPAVEIVFGKEIDFGRNFEESLEFDKKYQEELAYDIYIEETEKKATLLAKEKGMEIKNIKVTGDGKDIEKIEIEIEKPHSCVDSVKSFFGNKEECDVCVNAADEVRKSIAEGLGIDEVSVKILGD